MIQPLPSVEPALLLADLLEESDANLLAAFDSAALDGLPIAITSLLGHSICVRSTTTCSRTTNMQLLHVALG